MFNPERLSLIVQPIGDGGIRFYSYPTDDVEATVTAAGYATNAADYGLRAYDLIFVTPINGAADTYILAVDAIDADGHATLASPGPIGDLLIANNLSDVADAAAALANLGGMAEATYDPTAVGGDAFASANHSFTQSVTGAVARSAASKLGETKSVKDFGAVGDGVTDDLTAFQTALDNHSHIVVPPGNYILNGTLEINDYNVLVGIGPHTAGDTTTAATSTARLIFTNTTGPCFKAADEATSLLHAGFMNLTLRATTTATWFWDFKTIVGLKMAFIRANAVNAATGGFRSVKIDPGDSSWVSNWTDVEIRILDASAQYVIDTDMSDSSILGGAYTGGVGTILRGTGGTKLIGGRYDRSSGYGITISNETESKSQHTVMGCQIEENATGGVLIDGDADDTLTETWVTPIVVGNHFRNPAASFDIVFKNTSGPALTGGLIGPNSHNLSAVSPININGDWTRITINPSAHASTSGSHPRSYLGTVFRQSSLVLARGAGNLSHTGDTTETTLVTISVPANALGTTGQLRITTLWGYTNSANNKVMRVKFGGTTFTGVTTTTQAASQFITEIANISASSQIAAPANFIGIGSSTGAIVTSAIDTTTAQNITITAQLGDAGESITLRRYLVEIFPSSS